MPFLMLLMMRQLQFKSTSPGGSASLHRCILNHSLFPIWPFKYTRLQTFGTGCKMTTPHHDS